MYILRVKISSRVAVGRGDQGIENGRIGRGRKSSRPHTITIDGAVCARLFAITLDLFSAAFVASARYSSSLLDGLGWRVGCILIALVIGLDAG